MSGFGERFKRPILVGFGLVLKIQRDMVASWLMIKIVVPIGFLMNYSKAKYQMD